MSDQENIHVDEPTEEGMEELSDESLEDVAGGWTGGGGEEG